MATDQETLTCEIGKHKWKRDKTRGVKPKNCPKHKPVTTRPNPNGEQVLQCEIGKHQWTRPAIRGVKPKNCPEHKPTATRTVSVPGTQTLHCEIGNHPWERESRRGVKPRNCPDHTPVKGAGPGPDEIELKEYDDGSAMFVVLDPEFFNSVSTKPAKVEKTAEEKQAEKEAKGRERVANLTGMLKDRGTHLSQQEPYRLERLVKGVAGKRNAVYSFVEEHSPLKKEQFINQHAGEFEAGVFRYMRNGKVVVL